MRPQLPERVAKLEEKLKQLRTRQARVQARARALASRRERKDDTRRKILVGAVVLAKIDKRVLKEEVLRAWLDAALTGPMIGNCSIYR